MLKQDGIIVSYYRRSQLCRFSKEEIVYIMNYNYIRQRQNVLFVPYSCLDMIKLFAR